MRKNNTTAGVLFWTPAPDVSSLTSDGGCEDEDDGKDEGAEARREREEEEEDFDSQMDENGVIGLGDALEALEVSSGSGDGQPGPRWFEGAAGGTEASPAGRPEEVEPETPSEELSYSLSELQDSLSQNDPPGKDAPALLCYENTAGSVDVWTEDEELGHTEEEKHLRWVVQRRSAVPLPKNKQSDPMERNKEETAQVESVGIKQNNSEHAEMENDATGLNATGKVLVKSHVVRDEMISPINFNLDRLALEPNVLSSKSLKIGTGPQNGSGSNTFGCGTLSAFVSSNLLRPIPVSQSPPTSRPLSHLHLLHFSSEELACSPGIEDETFPETAFTESLPESYSSRVSQPSKHGWPHESDGEDFKHGTSSYPVDIAPKRDASCNWSGTSVRRKREPEKRHPPSLGKERQCSPETKYWSGSLKTSPDRGQKIPRRSPWKSRSIHLNLADGRTEPLSYSTPDFSKIEPRIHFPKSGYTPPKSAGPSRRSPSAAPPLVFMSPADIVREVLFSSTDGLASPDPQAPHHTVPEEFRCPRQATTLMEQLQEDYNRLLTKHAEAENTIDRLRLEAKVNLYSDPPKPNHTVQSGMVHQGSRVMTLTIPQAQRADLSSSPVHLSEPGPQQRGVFSPGSSLLGSSSSRSSFGPHMAQALTQTLSKHANRFSQQVQTFEDLLKRGRLKPFEQMTGVAHLAEGLDSVERGYLMARDEHRLLQHGGAQIGPFDPNRELEGLIFQCGMRVEELQDLAEQVNQGQPVPQTPPSPPPHPSTPLPVPSERREATPHPERPVLPFPGATGGAVGVEVSSVSGESEEEGSLQPRRSVDSRDTLVEADSLDPLMDHYQKFKELPNLDRNLKEVLFPAWPAEGVQPHAQEGKKPEQEPGRTVFHHNLPQSHRNAKSGCRDAPAVPTANARTSRSSPVSPGLQAQCPAHRAGVPSGHGRKSHSSSMTSLGTSKRTASKLQPGSTGVLSQDGIISPETDSGFIGSECGRHTPAAVASPLHQRAMESGSGGPPGRRVSAGGSVPSTSAGPISHGQTQGPAGTESRRGSATAYHSTENWPSQTVHLPAASGSRECGLDANSVSQEEVNGRLLRSRHGPSPTAPYRHDNPLGVNHNNAIQSLHVEVTRLKEKLESSLRHVRSPGSAQSGHTARHTSTTHVRAGQEEEEERDMMITGPGKDRPHRPAQKMRSASATKHQRRPATLAGTDSEQHRPVPQPQRCRHEPRVPPAQGQSRALGGESSRPSTRQHSGLSTAPSESFTLDEADSRARPNPVCPHCSSSTHPGLPTHPGGGSTEPVHTCAHHCPLCGQPEHCRSTGIEQACRQEPHPDWTASPSRGLAAPAPSVSGSVPLVLCVPLCPAPVLLNSSPAGLKMDSYLQPFCVSVSNGAPESPEVGGRAEVAGRAEIGGRERTGRRGRSVSADSGHSSLSSSLSRAIRAARDMKHTSQHMARSLAGGLCYQDLLSQSCIY